MDDAHFFEFVLLNNKHDHASNFPVRGFFSAPSYRMNLKNLHPIHFVLQVCVSWVKSTINSENNAEFWLIL